MSRAPGQAAGIHVVQFYEDEDFLCRAMARFFADGLRAGDPLVMLSTPDRYQRLIELLTASTDSPSIDASDASRVVFIDAEEVLASFMVDGKPDRCRLHRNVHALIEQVRAGRDDAMIWMCGDTSSRLCQAGNCAGAEALEHMWNDLFGHLRLSTLCAYAMSDFDGDTQAPYFRAICAYHDHVYPAEGFTEAGDDRARLEAVAVLQQRVRALDRQRPVHSQIDENGSADRGSTLYVIDDDVSVRRGLTRLLSALRQPAQIFDSAESFLAAVRPDEAGCLLVDIQLAGMSGTDLQRRMAGESWRMAVIAMSGLHDPEVEAEALNLGATTFLRKPFDAQTLLDAIARARNGR